MSASARAYGTVAAAASGLKASVVGGIAFASAISPGDAIAAWRIVSTGQEQRGINGSFATMGTWLVSGLNSDFEVMMSMNSGDAFTGNSLDTWLVCSTTRTWSLIESTDGFASKSGNGTLSIRLASSGTVLDSAVVVLTASVEL